MHSQSQSEVQSSKDNLVFVLGALTALGPLSIDAYLPGLPEIERQLGAAPGAGAITLSTYFLGLAGAQLVWGSVADRVGRRPPLIAGLLLYAAGSVLCGVATTLPMLAAARLVQGVGGAASMVITRTLVRDLWSGAEIARVMSLIMLVMGVAPVLAPPLGGLLLELASWRAVFALLTVAGVALAFVAFRAIPETKPAHAAEGFGAVLKTLFTDARFMAFTLATGASQAGMFSYISGSPDVLMEQLGARPLVYSACFGLNAAGLIAMSQWNRALLKRATPLRIGSVAITALLLTSFALVLVAKFAPSLWSIEALLFVYISLQGLVFANLVALALDKHARRAGLASATMGSLQFGVSAAASAAVGKLANGTALPMAGMMLAGAVVAFMMLLVGRRQ
ncbi:MAG: multidrug effflux MFS transporter [Archangium sp.]